MKLVFLIVVLVFQTTFSIQTNILEHLTQDDQTTLIMANQFMNIIPSSRSINQQQFTCLTLLPTKLTSQRKQPIHNLNITYNYDNKNKSPTAPRQSLQIKEEHKKIVGYRYDHDYEKILQLLHGTCVVHETTSFLYEYCHQEKVRQFDDVFTKQRMAKEHYEDIAMGYYDYQSALKKSTSPDNKALKPGNAVYEIQYSQNGDLTILSKLLENVHELTQQEKKLFEKTIIDTLQLQQQSQLQEGDANIGQTQSRRESKSKSTGSADKMREAKLRQIKLQALPTRSMVYDEKNMLTVETVTHKEYHLDKLNKIIHLNYPIVMTNKYFIETQITHQVTCENHINDSKISVYVSKGVVVSPYQVLFVGDVEKCDIVKQVSSRPIEEKPYGENYPYYDRVRAVGNIAFGYVEEICTNNWDWQTGGGRGTKLNSISPTKNNFLEPGATLWIEVAINSTINQNLITFHHYPITVKEVIANGVVRMEEQILSQIAQLIKTNDTVWINTCNIISKKPLNKLLYTTQNQIVKRNLIRIKQLPLQNPSTNPVNTNKKQSGDEMLCLCKFNKYGENFLQMHIELGQKLFDSNQQNNYYSYFEFFQTERTVKTQIENDPDLYTMCTAGLVCFDVRASNMMQKQQLIKTSQGGFTQITNVNSNTRPLTENLDIDKQVIILEISQFGMIKVHTQTSEGEKYQYLISPSLLIKFSQYFNGTKQVTNENPFYQNETSLHYASWLSTYLYIHKGYMWRGNDRMVFPRMKMSEGERITMVESLKGSAFVRRWDVGGMRHKKSNRILDVEDMFDQHYRMIKVPIYEDKDKVIDKNQQQNIKAPEQQPQVQLHPTTPLSQSVSLRYQYFHGDYCTHPIDKFRRTNVLLQCGQSWLRIKQVSEASPCVYDMVVETRLLCRQGYERVVDKVEGLNTKGLESRVNMEKGVVCYPRRAWDNVLYTCDVENKDFSISFE